MRCDVSFVDTTVRYTYNFKDDKSCVFIVDQAGIIFIEIKETIPFDHLCEALDEVSFLISEKGLTPTINIKNTNNFLKALARNTGFKKIPSNGISFSVWVRR